MNFELLLGVLRFLLATTLILVLTIPTAFVVIQMELKIIAGAQLRYGPNRIGPWGMFQSTIHGFKVLAKEDHIPDQADRATFTLAPWMVYMAAAMSMLVIPFAPGAIAADFNIGIVYFFAVLGLSVVGLLVAGWASYNKYSLLGGLRSAAQMVSYEIPLTLSVVGVVVLAGTLNFRELIEWQRVHGWMLIWLSKATRPGANGMTSMLMAAAMKTIQGASVKIGRSAWSGVTSSLPSTLKPWIALWKMPAGPTRLGPMRSCMRAIIFSSR